ncbi:MAG: hypothetical protein FWF01_00045 [Alphaproteobacteria bacterium]|nr:hypothetical protein [Alphaproteobacteria bacterium]
MDAEYKSKAFKILQQQIAGTNINPVTLLATDYLNHFNEVIMMMSLVPDSPELLVDCKRWRPKSYQQHFRDSTFKNKDLAIAAYNVIPERYRSSFEAAAAGMDEIIIRSLMALSKAMAANNAEAAKRIVDESHKALMQLEGILNGIINGNEKSLAQAQSEADKSFT